MQELLSLISLLDSAIKEDADRLITGGNIIADAYDEEVDRLRGVIFHSKNWLANYQAQLIEETGISHLKIKFTSASGYFIEVAKSSLSKVPEYFEHKQSLVNASRFVTGDLQNFQNDMIKGEQKLVEREYELFQEIREKTLKEFKMIKSS